MNNLDKKLERVIKPPRTNFVNLLYRKKNILQFFEKIDFELIAFDRTIIKGIFFKHISKERIKSTLIYNHSYGSCKYEGVYLLKHCHNFNMNLCIYDSRGSGETSNSFITFGFSEKIDLLYVIFKCYFFFKFDRFILWGRSIGCNTVLQFYQTMISHESSFLNNVLKKKNEKPNDYYTKSSKKKQKMLPKNFNKFVHMYFEAFLGYNYKNKLPKTENLEFKYMIQGIVLDSPYTSFDDFVYDNLKKFVPFLSGVLSLPIRAYLKSWLDSKINIDLDKKQNVDLIKVVNLNAVILISDIDEVVPLEKFEILVKNFAKKCGKKNKPRIYNTNQKHGAPRKDNIMNNTLKHMVKNIKPINTYIFNYKQKNPFIERPKVIPNNFDGIRLAKNLVVDKIDINYSESFNIKPRPSIDDISGGRTFVKNLESIDIDNIISKLHVDVEDNRDEELEEEILNLKKNDQNFLKNQKNYEIYKNNPNNFSPGNINDRNSEPIHLKNNNNIIKINSFQSVNYHYQNNKSNWNKVEMNLSEKKIVTIEDRNANFNFTRNRVKSYRDKNFRKSPILVEQVINTKRNNSQTHQKKNFNLIRKKPILINDSIKNQNHSDIKTKMQLKNKNKFQNYPGISVEKKKKFNIFDKNEDKKIKNKESLPEKQLENFRNLIETQIYSKLENGNNNEKTNLKFY